MSDGFDLHPAGCDCAVHAAERLAAAEARAEAAEEKVSAWVKDYCTLALALANTFDRAEAAEREKTERAARDQRRYEHIADTLHKAVLRAEAAERDRDWWRARAEAVEALADEWRRQAVPGEWSSALHPRRAADAIRAALDAAAEDPLLKDYDPVPGLVARGVATDPEDDS